MFPGSEMIQALALDKLHHLRQQATQAHLLRQAPRPGRLKLAALLRKLAQRLDAEPVAPPSPFDRRWPMPTS